MYMKDINHWYQLALGWSIMPGFPQGVSSDFFDFSEKNVNLRLGVNIVTVQKYVEVVPCFRLHVLGLTSMIDILDQV